jgi:hypothetical protein
VGECNQVVTDLQVGKFLVDIIKLEVDIIKFKADILVVKVDMCQEDINNLLMQVELRDKPTTTSIMVDIERIGVVKRIEVRPNLDKRMAVQLQREDIQLVLEDNQEVGTQQELVRGIKLLVRGILDTEELGNLMAIDLRLQL